MIRNRVVVQDLSLVLATVLVAAYVAFEFDVYASENGATRYEQTIEPDEALTLGGILCVGLLVFAARRYRELRQETLRRTAAEQYGMPGCSIGVGDVTYFLTASRPARPGQDERADPITLDNAVE